MSKHYSWRARRAPEPRSLPARLSCTAASSSTTAGGTRSVARRSGSSCGVCPWWRASRGCLEIRPCTAEWTSCQSTTGPTRDGPTRTFLSYVFSLLLGWLRADGQLFIQCVGYWGQSVNLLTSWHWQAADRSTSTGCSRALRRMSSPTRETVVSSDSGKHAAKRWRTGSARTRRSALDPCGATLLSACSRSHSLGSLYVQSRTTEEMTCTDRPMRTGRTWRTDRRGTAPRTSRPLRCTSSRLDRVRDRVRSITAP